MTDRERSTRRITCPDCKGRRGEMHCFDCHCNYFKQCETCKGADGIATGYVRVAVLGSAPKPTEQPLHDDGDTQ